MMVSSGYSDTICKTPRKCFSRDEVNAIADAACASDALLAKRSAELVRELGSAETALAVCRNKVAATPPPVRQAPIWLRVALDISIGALAAGTGAAAGIGAPDVVIGAGAAFAVSALAARLVLELLQWK